MSLTDAAENDLLDLIFRNNAWTNVGDTGGLLPSAAAGSLYISLHTASPGETGNQTTSEATFGGYARVAVPRVADGSGWSLTGSQASNAAAVTFAQATSGSNNITHFGIGTASTGTGNLLAYGALTQQLTVSTGVTAQFAVGALDVDAA